MNTNLPEIMQRANACATHQEAALVYARAGYPVFPCNPDKSPRTPNGFYDATTDEKLVWDGWDFYPESLIAIPTGATTGLLVVDLDCKDDRNGLEEFARILGKEFELSVPTVRTPSGGLHLYFAHPGIKVTSNAGKIAPGIDIRADGGYIIVPPSAGPNGRYTVLHAGCLGPIPPALEAALQNAGAFASGSTSPVPMTLSVRSADGVAVSRALMHISPDCSYEEWFQVGVALHDWNPVDGLALFTQWSAQGQKYKTGEPEAKWASFGNRNPGMPRITIRSLFALARKHGYVGHLPVLSAEDPLAKQYGDPIVCKTATRCDVNQQYVAAYHVAKTGIIFDNTTNAFWLYDPKTGLYGTLTASQVLHQLAQTYQEVLADHGMINLLASRKTSELQQIIALMRGIAHHDNAFSKSHDCIHVANGMLHIAEDGTIELLPFSPEYFSRNRSEIAWDPNAQCPEFLSSLSAVMLPDDQRILQRYLGQCLLGENISQTILILRGPAATMKSTTQNIAVKLIGEVNTETLRPEHLGSRFEKARFYGRTLLIGSDVSRNFLSAEASHNLKSLVGGDKTSTEVKNVQGGPVIRGVFNICITSNVDLHIKLDGDRLAWKRRLIILDYFTSPVKAVIPDYASYIIAKEGPGMLRWAVEGAAALLMSVGKSEMMPLSDVQTRRVDDLLSQSDSVNVFVATCVVKDQASHIAGSQLHEAYESYCDLRGWSPVSKRDFEHAVHRALETKCQAKKSHNIPLGFTQVRGYRGVRLAMPSADLDTQDSSSGNSGGAQ